MAHEKIKPATKKKVGAGKVEMSETRQEPVNSPATSSVPQQQQAENLPLERDRRGVALPARQRVGGIITPQ